MGLFSPTCDEVADLYPRVSGKVAIVTGSSTGIGLEVARVLCKRGARVILANRTIPKAEKAADVIRKSLKGVEGIGTVEVIKLDLMDFASVKSFCDAFNDLGVPLDILVLNAGIMATPLRFTAQGWESQMGTNHLGHFALTYWLLPKLIESGNARVVATSSGAHAWAHDTFDWPSEGHKGFYSDEGAKYEKMAVYGDSKSANILFAKELCKRYKEQGIYAASCHPGVVQTELARDFSLPIRILQKAVGRILLKSPAQGAASVTRAVLDSSVPDGSYLVPTSKGPEIKYPKRSSQNMETAKKLWDVSEEIITSWESKL